MAATVDDAVGFSTVVAFTGGRASGAETEPAAALSVVALSAITFSEGDFSDPALSADEGFAATSESFRNCRAVSSDARRNSLDATGAFASTDAVAAGRASPAALGETEPADGAAGTGEMPAPASAVDGTFAAADFSVAATVAAGAAETAAGPAGAAACRVETGAGGSGTAPARGALFFSGTEGPVTAGSAAAGAEAPAASTSPWAAVGIGLASEKVGVETGRPAAFALTAVGGSETSADGGGLIGASAP